MVADTQMWLPAVNTEHLSPYNAAGSSHKLFSQVTTRMSEHEVSFKSMSFKASDAA